MKRKQIIYQDHARKSLAVFTRTKSEIFGNILQLLKETWRCDPCENFDPLESKVRSLYSEQVKADLGAAGHPFTLHVSMREKLRGPYVLKSVPYKNGALRFL